MTPRRLAILDFLRSYIAKQGVAPRLSDIGDAFGFSKVTAREHLLVLEREGYIHRNPLVERGIRVIEPPTKRALDRLKLIREGTNDLAISTELLAVEKILAGEL